MTPSPPALWSTEVEAASYAGHPGRHYRIRPTGFGDLLGETARFDDRVFLVHGDRRITYRRFRDAVVRTAATLRDDGVHPGDRVVLHGYNSPEWVLALWSLWLAGAVPVLANRWWSATELAHALELLQPTFVLADTDLDTPVPTSALADLAGAFTEHAHTGSIPSAHETGDEDEVALVLFTSGSSGLPKAVELTRRSVIANQQNILQRNGRFPDTIAPGSSPTVSLATTPMFHVGGLSSLLTHVLTGGRIVLAQGRFDAGDTLALIERERVQIWGAVPTMAVRVLDHPRFAEHDLSSLRSWPLGGSPVTTELLDRIRSALPQLRERGLSNTWGMTEGGGFLTIADGRDLLAHPGTVGRPYPVVEVRITDPDADGIGEILARSPTVMAGYVGTTEQPVDADGWLHTGDLGHLEDGYLFVDGRRKDIVIRGGENIACPHVEAALLSHPDVTEAAALGLPHPDLGEELAAVVVHRGPQAPSAETLRAHLTGRVAYFAIPTRWVIRTEPLPTLAGEKVDKRSLVGEFT